MFARGSGGALPSEFTYHIPYPITHKLYSQFYDLQVMKALALATNYIIHTCGAGNVRRFHLNQKAHQKLYS